MNKLDLFLDADFPAGSFCHALQRFIRRQRRRGLSEYSIAHLFNSLVALGEWLNDPPLADVSPRRLRAYVDSLWLRYAPGTIRPIIGDIRQFFRWAKRKGLIGRNPAKRLHKPRLRRTRGKAAPETAVSAVFAYLVGQLPLVYRDLFGQLQYADRDEWSYAEQLALRDLFIVVFLYETGGRARELAQLGARVMDRACQEAQAAYVVTSTGKTNDRDLRFTNATAELWRLWRAVRPGCECSEYAVHSLRPHRPSAPLTSNGISQMLARRCEEAGATVFRAHALRHAKVRRARRLVGLEMASLLVDHSSVEMTRNYANVEEDEVETAVTKTGVTIDLWNPPPPK